MSKSIFIQGKKPIKKIPPKAGNRPQGAHSLSQAQIEEQWATLILEKYVLLC